VTNATTLVQSAVTGNVPNHQITQASMTH